MCGRFSQTSGQAELQARFEFATPSSKARARYNIAPTQLVPVVVLERERTLAPYRWGLIPSWVTDPATGSRMINARIETLHEKPSFRTPLRRRRCLVPCDGWYEWKNVPDRKTKVPYRIVRRDREPFGLAGLWESWNAPDDKEVRSFTIVTTAANRALKTVHDRMPAVLAREAEGAWLNTESGGADVRALLGPAPDDAFEAYEVATAVNSPRSDAPEMIEAIR